MSLSHYIFFAVATVVYVSAVVVLYKVYRTINPKQRKARVGGARAINGERKNG